MRMPRVRMTLRGTMIAVALVSLNLYGAMTTSRYFPLPMIVRVGWGNQHSFVEMQEDGSVLRYVGMIGGKATSSRMVSPPRPKLIRFWSPVIACSGITLLSLILVGRERFRRPAVRRLVLMSLVLVTTVSLRWWWVLEGRSLPLWRLQPGMTKPEVLAVVGPPNPKGVDVKHWLVAPHGSLYWLNLEFNDEGRLRAYPPDRHWVGKLGAFHPDEF